MKYSPFALVLSIALLMGVGLQLEAQPASPSAASTPTVPAASSNSSLAAGLPGETKEQRDARMEWWRSARFGMFIHWGVYSVPAGTYHDQRIPGIGEWIMNNGSIPVAEYANFTTQFNPVQFDAEAWVKTARDAGMKYIVITAKHHDGFAMFHTAVDTYNIFDATPFHRDPLKELAAACQKYGIKLGFYYSQSQDWHHPGGAALKPNSNQAVAAPRPATNHWDPAQDGDYDAYLKNVAIPQVKELLSNYGPVSVLWFDTSVNMTPERVAEFLPLLKLQPNIIVNNRLTSDKNLYRCDTETPEQRIPATGYADGRDWETCMTINDTWGFKSYDTNFKSTETLLHNLIDIASKGGNYLLNVGPTSLGIIPQPEVDRLKAMGEWMKVNGEAIYGTTASTFTAIPGVNASVTTNRVTDFGQWRATTKPGKIYIHLFKWPTGKFDLDGLKGQVTKAYLLADADHKALTVTQDGTKISVTLPAQAPDPIASVLCLEVTGK